MTDKPEDGDETPTDDGASASGEPERPWSPVVVEDFDPAERAPQIGRGRLARRELKARIKGMVLAFEANGETLSYQPRSRMVRLVVRGLRHGERWVRSADGGPWDSAGTDMLQARVTWGVRKKHSESDAAIRELIKGVVKEIKAERTR